MKELSESSSISGSGESSSIAAARQDASTFTTSSGDFFAFQVAAEELTPSTVTVTTTINDVTLAASEQVISSRWPEAYITEDDDLPGSSIYSTEFPTSVIASNGIVVNVDIRGKDLADGTPGPDISGKELLEGYTAIDFDLIVDGHFADSPADSASKTTTAEGLKFHNFLWLFRKGTSAGGSGVNDSRSIALFKLASVQKIENSGTVKLSYEQVH